MKKLKGVFMKIKLLAATLIALNAVSAYCGGLSEENLVNVQEINLEHITDIQVLYQWEKIVIHQNDTDAFMIKEYGR
jgi:hypothetical protein